MDFPFQIIVFGTEIKLHLIFETLAFFIGIRYYYFLRKKRTDSISDINRLWILLGAMIGALIGSRLIGVLEVKNFNFSLEMFMYNKTVLGGFLGGLSGVEICKKLIGEKTSSGDLYVLPIILALLIGRIGCFSMGVYEQTYGIETYFFTGMDLGDGKLRHPIMLYEMLFLAVLIIFFTWFEKHRNTNYINGDAFKMFMLLYFGFRFITEFLKPYHPIFLDLSIIHWCVIFLYIYYYQFIIKFFK